MEMSMISAALSSIKSATDLAKTIKDSASRLEGAEMKLELAELISSLADAKIEVSKIKEVVLEKDEEIKKLKKELDEKGKIIWEKPYYFSENEKGEKEGPFCQKCYDSKKARIRLQSPKQNGHWECKECKNYYQDKNCKATVGVKTGPKPW